jgi:tetratricopeptide (TPR) repeat protein
MTNDAFSLWALCLAAAALAAGCSSAPKKPAEIVTVRNTIVKQLDYANSIAAQGRFAEALPLAEEARRLALTVDDPPLLVRTALSTGFAAFNMGQVEAAFAAWNGALAEAEAAGDQALAALSRVYLARGQLNLMEKGRGGDLPGGAPDLETLKNTLRAGRSALSADAFSQGLLLAVLALAEKAGRNYAAAEAALREALALHQKGLFLAEAAYDHYLLASVFSVAGRAPEAEQALREAIALDRKAENGWGLASDWRALARVYRDAGKTAQADEAARRAEAIAAALRVD